MTPRDPLASAGADGTPPAGPPHRVRLPVNLHEWRTIAFLHWPVDPALVAARLPGGLVPHTFEGRAWVGVTPFEMRVRPPGVPVVPPGWAFPETNVRTYVRGPDGAPGLWFLHMEASAAWFVAALRLLGLPYRRRRMRVEASDGRIAYRSVAPPGAAGGHDVVVRPGPQLRPLAGDAFVRFLTARWRAYHRRGALLVTPVAHPPWVLHAAEVLRGDVDGLFRAAGLALPSTPPLAHWSPGTAVRVGPPRRADRPQGAVGPGS